MTPFHESSCGSMASACQTWLSREDSLLSLRIPAASGEEVTMGTDTKGLMLEGKAGEGAERGFK